MSTSSTQSLRSREFGNRCKNLLQTEENDVFYSATENVAPIVGKNAVENGPRRVQALSDSSNSLKKSKSGGLGLGGNGKSNSFGFKKPTPLSSRITKSSREDSITQDPFSKLVRSNSVPTAILRKSAEEESSNIKDKEEEHIHNIYDFYDETYPEPEFLRDISLQDLKEYIITSPIEIGLDDTEDFRPRNGNDSVIIEEEDEPDMAEDDDSYPEIEKLPAGYATQVLMEDSAWMRDMNIAYEKDDPNISEPPYLEHDFEGDLAFITDYLSSAILASESFDNIPQSYEEDSFDEGADIFR